jgi:predicted RecA/RadA family phage recombinase
MPIKAQVVQGGAVIDWTADADYSSGDVIQLPDGRAGVITVDIKSGFPVGVYVTGIFKMLKTTSMVLLKGGRSFWDKSASKIYFRPINDQDFYAGSVAADAMSSATTCLIDLNKVVQYLIDASRDPGLSVPVGTAAAGGFGRGVGWKGSGLNLNITATSEAQKIDWLSKDGFAVGANAIVEFTFSVPTGSGAGGAQDLNIGVADGTHASDGDSIANHVFMHFDGNAVKLNFQSKSTGKVTVTAQDSLTTLTAGQSNAAGVRKEVWMDLRDPTDVQCYVDGVLVLGAQLFDISGATTLQLLAHLEKTTGTETAEVDVDFLAARIAQI